MLNPQQEDVHSAVPSWNGYLYQGKIALYVLIDYLLEHYDENLDNHNLELEWLEDFSIKNCDKYLSIHQVKCKQSRRFSGYKDAFWKLLDKVNKGYTDSAKLHVANQIEDYPVNAKELIEDHQPSFDHNISDEDVSLLFDKVQLYEYHNNNNYCGLDDLNGLLLSKLEEFYETHFPEDAFRHDSRFLFRCLLKLYHHIEERLRIIHLAIHEGEGEGKKQEISIDKIQEVIKDPSHSDATYEYKIYKLYECIDLAYQNFCYNNELISEDGNTDLVDQYYLEIKSIRDHKFQDFCLSITPHKQIINNVPNIDYLEIRDAFLRILQKISSKKAKFEKSLLIYRANDNIYLPIALKGYPEDSELHGKDIFEQARQSSKLIKLLYTIDCFISYKNNFHSLKDIINEGSIIKNVPEQFDVNIKEKFNSLRNVSMINLENAKRVLNND